MKILLMTAVFVLSAFVPLSGALAEDRVVNSTPAQPQIVVTTKGSTGYTQGHTGYAYPPGYPYYNQKPKNTRETTTLTDANGVTYQVVRTTRYDSDGNPTIRTVAKGPDGREVELKTEVETDN